MIEPVYYSPTQRQEFAVMHPEYVRDVERTDTMIVRFSYRTPAGRYVVIQTFTHELLTGAYVAATWMELAVWAVGPFARMQKWETYRVTVEGVHDLVTQRTLYYCSTTIPPRPPPRELVTGPSDQVQEVTFFDEHGTEHPALFLGWEGYTVLRATLRVDGVYRHGIPHRDAADRAPYPYWFGKDG